MHWLYLLLAFGTLLLAIFSTSGTLIAFWLVASLVLLLAWARGFYLDRVGGTEQDPSTMIDPVELRRLRELAEARRQQARQAVPGAGTEPPQA